MTLHGDDGARYLRQRMLAEVGTEGQALLEEAVVSLVGGSASARIHAADYLLRAGVMVHVGFDDDDRDDDDDQPSEPPPEGARHVTVLGPLTCPAAVAPAKDLLLGALTAVESIKQVLGVGQPADLPANLFLLGDD